MAFGNTPKDVTLIPLGSVAVPNHTGGDLTALEGGPASTDTNGNETAPASMYVKDGGNVAQGSLADAAWSGSGNGTNIAILKKIVAGQSGVATVVQSTGASAGTFWRIGGDFAEQAGLSAGALNADLVPATDVSGFKWWALQIATVATGGVLTFQWSNDNVTYNSLTGLRLDTLAAGGAGFATSTANTLFGGPVTFRYLRVRQTAWTSGTSTGTLELYTVPPTYPALTIKISDTAGNSITSNNSGLSTAAVAATSGGASNFHLVSAATTNATNIKSSAGQVYGYEIFNASAAVRFVKLYNKATAPAPATDVPLRTIGIPAGATKNVDLTTGLAFSLGIGVATVQLIADTDPTAVAAGDLVIDIAWK